MLQPLLRNDTLSSVVEFRTAHKFGPVSRSRPCGSDSLPEIPATAGAGAAGEGRTPSGSVTVRSTTSLYGAEDHHPDASSSRLRICRLMYKPLPHGSCKLNVRHHHRNRRLALDKKRTLGQSFLSRRAIPQYFQQRLKHKFLVKKSAYTLNSAKQRAARRESVVSADDTASSLGEASHELEAPEVLPPVDELEQEDTTTGTEIVPIGTAKPQQDAESVESKVIAVRSLSYEAPIAERTRALGTINEYLSIQKAVRLLLAMLQERMEEVESLPKKSAMAALKDVKLEEDIVSAATDDAEASSKENLTDHADPERRTPASIVADPDTNKENNVPLESALEAVPSPASVVLNRLNSTSGKDDLKDEPGGGGGKPPYSLLESSKTDILDPGYTCDIELEPLESRKNRSIVDSLLNKFNLSPPAKATVPPSFYDGSDGTEGGRRSLRDRTKIAARPRYIEIPEEPRKMRVSKVFGKLHKTLNIDLDCANSNSSTEFYGFDEGEVVKLDKPSLPGLLPTPIVKKSQPYAPFLTYGTSIGTELPMTGAETRSDLFREEGLISFGSMPPRLECPQRPNDMVRPRTVAQKRILVQRENDVRYLMIDNESKIYQFIEKRGKNIALDFCRMRELQDQQIPFTRDSWRALSWLRTENGRYYFQTITIDSRTVKLTGCKGNHRFKSLARHPLYSSPVVASRGHRYHYVSNCRCPEFPKGVVLDIVQQEGSNAKSSANGRPSGDISRYLFRSTTTAGDNNSNTDHQKKRSYPGTKPGPLSSKCVQPAMEDDPCLGPMEVFQMPPVELEVFPKINRPLDGFVKPYLKMILPHDGITENWARFAVSTLRDSSPDGAPARDGSDERSFVFELPYLNNQRRLLIRRLVKAGSGDAVSIDVERFGKLMDEKLTFREKIDQARDNPDEVVDPDELICADVLRDMTDAVAIALAEDLFVKDDPDIDYSSKRNGMVRPSYHEQKTMPNNVETLAQPLDAAKPPTPCPPGGDQSGAAAGDGATSECSSKTNDPVKSKLLREMKRLNATIIEGPSQPTISPVAAESSRQQRCDAKYCSLGCLCDVLLSDSQTASTANQQRKQHCRRNGCIFGCVCGYEQKLIQHTQEVQMDCNDEQDGKTTATLSSADVKYLREKATARLAKEEREFTPTVILTKNTTVLVRNTESETRRLKKKPKKYDDYYNDQSVQCLLNGGSVLDDITCHISKPPPNAKPLTPADRMRHAHVLLTRIPQLADMEPLCMVHDLYRCFCGGKATQGKPFSFAEDSNYPTVLPKGSGSASPLSAPIALEISSGVAGRMMKASTTTLKQQRDQPSETSAYYEAFAPVVNVRKRLYSFERANGDESDDEQKYSSSNANEGNRAFRSVAHQPHRRQRDSSEESYRPPGGRKVAKKKAPHATVTFLDGNSSHGPSSGGGDGGSIRARRASVAHGLPPPIRARRASVAVRRPSVTATRPSLPPPASPTATASRRPPVEASLAKRRASVADTSRSPKAIVNRRSDPVTPVEEAQYTTVIKPKKESGPSGINNIIIKRIPPQQSSPATNPLSPPPWVPAASPKKETKDNVNAPSAVMAARMTVREVRELMLREHKGTDITDAEHDPSTIMYIAMVDSEDNIAKEPQLKSLSERTKKLVISGNRRAFVDNQEFNDRIPPAHCMPNRKRATYVVQVPEVEAVRVARMPGNPSANSATARTSEQQSKRVQPPAPVLDPVQQTDRQLESLMRHINELLRRPTLNISTPKMGLLYICRWKLLLHAFALGKLDVLDVVLGNDLELTIITTSPANEDGVLPIPHVRHQVSARHLTLDKMLAVERPSLLMKMVVSQVENVKTDELALVLYGNEGFWHFCGFLRVAKKAYQSNSNVLVAPSTKVIPRLKTRLKEYYRKAFPASAALVGGGTANAAASVAPQQLNGSASDAAKPTALTISPSTQSNIEIVVRSNAQTVSYPLISLLPAGYNTHDGCRWLRLKIENDFSHMYLPKWQCCLTYGRIKRAIFDANRSKAPVQLETPSPQNCLMPYMYALPREGTALFIGPYKKTATAIDVILCQSVDQSLYEREVYEQLNGITACATKRTVGSWIEVDPTNGTGLKEAGTSGLQRSLLKRNNARQQSQSQSSQPPVPGDEILDEVTGRIRTVAVSAKQQEKEDARSANSPPVQTHRELTAEHLGIDLYRLVEGTMKQNQQKKREIEKVIEQQRSSCISSRNAAKVASVAETRKRKSNEPSVSNIAFEPKVARYSHPVGARDTSSAVVKRPDPPSTMPAPDAVGGGTVTLHRSSSTRVSLPNPEEGMQPPLPPLAALTVLKRSAVSGDKPAAKTTSSVSNGQVRHASPPAPPPAKPLSVAQLIANCEKAAPRVGGPLRPRLYSVAVERPSQARPAAPAILNRSVDDEDVICLDDDDDDDARPPPAKKSNGNAASVANGAEGGSSGKNVKPQPFKEKTFLSQQQVQLIGSKVDLTKTGQQNGYSYNPASGVLRMRRSLLNSLTIEGLLRESPATGGRSSGATSSNRTPVTPVAAAKPVAAPAAASKPPSTTPPAATITMPRTKVVPRVTVKPATALYGEVNRDHDQTGVSEASSSSASANASAQSLKYVSDGQHLSMLRQPHTQGVLESKIPGLGLVEIIRFDRQVVINMKELTVRKQMVCVPNLEAAVTLINQFIQRNTFTFRPHNLIIQWEFKEQSTPVPSEKKLTSIINQHCVVTRHGIINMNKPDQLRAIEDSLPALYEDLMHVKLAMQCYNKQRFESEKCNENIDTIYQRAVEVITTLEKRKKWLHQLKDGLIKVRSSNEAKIRKLAKPPVDGTDKADASGDQEAVIVIEDD
uniref:MGA conserved domain-containing protein n=1 Tax=Anopheles dirus TaxID=7168 RepID=A0A182NPA4_9DIPT